jgi:hypothetical protein
VPGNARRRVTVLYVMGSARSGSTILANLLGEASGFVSVGELRFLWERASQGRKCGCGERVAACPLWSQVLEDQRLMAPVSVPEIIRIDHGPLRLPNLPKVLRAPGTGDVRRYVNALGAVVRSIVERTGARVIVDSSKRPSNGAAMRWIPDVDVRYLHLVRDARAVAHSRLRRKTNPDADAPSHIGGVSVWNSGVHWCASNAAADLVRRKVGPERSLLVRYEDFVERPQETLAHIGALIDEDLDYEGLTSEGQMLLGTNHSVSGNPDRFVTGRVTLRSDDRWRTGLSTAERLKVEVLCGPQLLRYGYPLHQAKTAA